MKRYNIHTVGKKLVYLITCKITDKKYVGIVWGKSQTVARRWQEHCKDARTFFPKCKYLNKAIRKYGEQNFTVEIIDSAGTLKQLEKKERYWTKFFDSLHNGYNGHPGGCCGPEDQGEILSAKARKQWQDSKFRNKVCRALRTATWRANNRIGAARKKANPRWQSQIKKQLKELWANPTFRANQLASINLLWTKPSFRRKQRKGAQSIFVRHPELKEVKRQAALLQWSKPGAKEAHSKRLRKIFENPKLRAARSKQATLRWKRWREAHGN